MSWKLYYVLGMMLGTSFVALMAFIWAKSLAPLKVQEWLGIQASHTKKCDGILNT